MSACIDVVADLLNRLAERDIRVGIHLDIDHPNDVLPDDVRDELVALRPQLLSQLASREMWGSLKGLRWGGATLSDPNIVVDRLDPEVVGRFLGTPRDAGDRAEREAIANVT